MKHPRIRGRNKLQINPSNYPDNMKNYLTLAAVLTAMTAFTQVEIDKPVQLTGGTGERYVTGLEMPVNNADAVNKEYVDAAVSASGGGGLHTLGDGSLPTMLSAVSPTPRNYFSGISYCRNLTENSHSDWRLATFQEVSYLLSDDAIYATIPDPTSATYFYVAIETGPGNSSSYGYFYVRLSDGSGAFHSLTDASFGVRCVR
jgi:hypothetical protein